jgi:hypothetical protein
MRRRESISRHTVRKVEKSNGESREAHCDIVAVLGRPKVFLSVPILTWMPGDSSSDATVSYWKCRCRYVQLVDLSREVSNGAIPGRLSEGFPIEFEYTRGDAKAPYAVPRRSFKCEYQ